jgi:molybdate transport system ATP-binding protein
VTLAAHGVVRVGSTRVELDLDVAPGETVALLGPNGAGKTTLLRALAGLLRLEEGRVQLGDTVLEDTADGVHVPVEERSTGMVFQDPRLFPNLDVRDNVAFGLQAAGQRRRSARVAAAGWLDRLGMAPLTRAMPAQLSGGEAQQVALARALARGPAVLLLDEPLGALDADRRSAMRTTLREHLQANHAGPCLLVTHDPVDAAVLADRVIVLEHGRVTHAGSLAEMVARPRTPWAAELAGTNLLWAAATGVHLELPGGGTLMTAERTDEGPVMVAVRPAAVALHAMRPEGSPRNVWQASVAEVEGYAERVRVRLTGPVPLVAEVTTAAVAALDLHIGSSVWASVKATDVTVYPA